MIDYFALYQSILKSVRDDKPGNRKELIKSLTYDEYIKKMRSNGIADDLLIESIFETVDNLLDDGLIKGEKLPVKEEDPYSFKGLSTFGHQYLSAVEKPEFKERLKAILKEEGLPLNPQSVSKAISNLLW
ncbi:hypothetical protein [Oceanobacillus timonensis]|uniref:hypothetical protein n=1 Tax=Oceanobacillus timonensis TaxID=1926285 RepID=UPI0009BB4A95|nr:hypothetical protein [Oceanobacillus timonensis]